MTIKWTGKKIKTKPDEAVKETVQGKLAHTHTHTNRDEKLCKNKQEYKESKTYWRCSLLKALTVPSMHVTVVCSRTAVGILFLWIRINNRRGAGFEKDWTRQRGTRALGDYSKVRFISRIHHHMIFWFS